MRESRPYTGSKQSFAAGLRNNPTKSEIIMERTLILARIKYEAQPVLLGFIPDFLIKEGRVVIEVDGGVHESPHQKELDWEKDAIFREHGYSVVRITNKELQISPEDCLAKIRKAQKLFVSVNKKSESLSPAQAKALKKRKKSRFKKEGRGGLNHPVRMDIVVIPPKPSTPC